MNVTKVKYWFWSPIWCHKTHNHIHTYGKVFTSYSYFENHVINREGKRTVFYDLKVQDPQVNLHSFGGLPFQHVAHQNQRYIYFFWCWSIHSTNGYFSLLFKSRQKVSGKNDLPRFSHVNLLFCFNNYLLDLVCLLVVGKWSGVWPN